MTSVKMDIHIIVDEGNWARKFRDASPSERAILFTQLMDAFNDGVGGVDVSFSEPVINASEDAK